MFHVKRSREGGMFHVKQKEGGVPVFGGGLPSLPPADLAFSLLFCPHPPDPLPDGKGEIFCFLMQGAPPLASPGLSLRGTGFFCRISAFLPPSPRPALAERSSRREGGDFCFILPGADAPGTPATEPAQHWLNRGAGAPGTPATEPARCWLAGRLRPLHPRG